MKRVGAFFGAMLATFGASHADSDVEHPRYAVVSSAGDIEIRDYAPLIVARTDVAGERSAAINEGFRRLAGFIFGDNDARGKIAMTAPVTQQASEKIPMTAPVGQASAGPGVWTVTFTMPSASTRDSLPRPNNPDVTLVEIPGRRMAAIRFPGLVDDRDLAANETKLRTFLSEKGLTARGGAQYAFYDPPWTLPFNRRNEVLVEVARP